MRGLSRTRSAIAAIFAAVVFTLVGASAASAVVPGGLLGDRAAWRSSAPCVAVSQVGTPTDIAVSPDGANVYVTTSSSALVIFQPQRRDGPARVPAVPARRDGGHGLHGVADRRPRTLSSPTAIAITPDGAHVYVASAGNSTIHEFSRAGDGALTLKAGSPVHRERRRSAAAPVHRRAGHGSPQDLAVEGGSLYVASSGTPGGVTRADDRPGRVARPVATAAPSACSRPTRTTALCGRGLPGANSIAVRGAQDLRRHGRRPARDGQP